MKKLPLVLVVAVCSLLAVNAMAQSAPTPDVSIANTVTASIKAGATKVLPMAVGWLGSFMALQFVLTNIALLKSGAELEAVFGKLIGSITWFGFCIYLLNEGPGFIESVGGGILNQFGSKIPTPGEIITSTLAIAALLVGAIAAVGTSIIGNGNSSLAMLLVYLLLALVSIGLYMAIKVLMLQIELALIIALAPLSFSLLGLNALRDQGIAPLKSLIALVYRIILMGILCSAFTEVLTVTFTTINNFAGGWSVDNFGKAVKAVLSAMCAFPIIAFLVYKSDSIASSLAGGGSSLGAGDVASAAAAGAAAGAAVGAASGGAVGAVGKLPQSMSSVLGNMMSSNGSISNVSSSGTGATSAAKPPFATPSFAGGPSSGSAKPVFPTNKAGAPQPLDTKSGANAASGSTGAPPAQAVEDAKSADSFSSGVSAEAGAGAESVAIGGIHNTGDSGMTPAASVQGSFASTTGAQGSALAGTAPARSTPATTSSASSGGGSESRTTAGYSPMQSSPSMGSAQRSGTVSAWSSRAAPSSSGTSSGASTDTASARPIPSFSSSQSSAPVGTPPARRVPAAGSSQSSAPVATSSAKQVPLASGEASSRATSATPTSPVLSSVNPQSSAPVSEVPPGVGTTAGIAGNQNNELSQAVQKLTETLGQNNRAPSLTDHLKTTGQHVASEKATTSISINPHHHE